MSYLLPHLTSGWACDQAILSEETRLVCIRFGHDYDPVCMQMDEVLYSIAEKVKNWRERVFANGASVHSTLGGWQCGERKGARA